ncbi:tetratricopeptide repeat protein [Solimonas sp. K1W22B-7]|nr:tetratricopeptide repeat protein [Solimonas sp. K1W22B-7]
MLKFCRIAAAAIVFASAPVLAASVAEEAQSLLNQGNAADALRKVETHLQANPQDAQARFVRGLALVRLNRTEQAIRVFADLTRDYPQLPEPYNNLAVLYAQQGDYERARDALEAALATHPSYATAHENLGDIYAALAGASYNRALMLDPGNGALRRKLGLVGQLDNTPSDPATTVAAPAPRAAPAPAAAAPMPPPAAAPAATEVDAATTQAVNATLASWSQSWAGKNLEAYFALYAPDFQPEGGLSRGAWEAQRRDRITRPKRISVKAVNPQITRAGDTLRVSFRQDYESDAFSDQVSKTLELKQVGGSWKISREYTR